MNRPTAREESDRAGKQDDDERPRTYPHLWSGPLGSAQGTASKGRVDSLLDPHVKTEIKVVDAEPAERPLDDRTGTNQRRNCDPDDFLGGDHALLPAGFAREKPHVTGATAVRTAMEAGHADRHR